MRPDEYLVPGGEVTPLSRHEIEQALGDDPEVTLISDYLAGALPPGDAEAVERRLRDDQGFAERVGPIADAWQRWPGAADFALSPDELAASRERLLARMDREAKAPSAPSGRSLRGRPTMDSDARRRLRRWQLAAGLALAVGLPSAAWVGATLQRRAMPPRTHSMQAMGRDRMPVPLGNGSLALVESGSRVTWSDAPDTGQVRELLLDGEAQFQLRHIQAGHYIIVTPAARVIVTGTDFRVSAMDPAVTTVVVYEGTVVLESRGVRSAPLLSLGAGERGMAIWGQPARRIR